MLTRAAERSQLVPATALALASTPCRQGEAALAETCRVMTESRLPFAPELTEGNAATTRKPVLGENKKEG